MKTPTTNQGASQQYGGVRDLLDRPAEKRVLEQLERLTEETRLVQELTLMRTRAGLTQVHMAEKLGCTQGWISKIESSLDADLTIGILQAYTRATHSALRMEFRRPWTEFVFLESGASGRQPKPQAVRSVPRRAARGTTTGSKA